MSKHNTDTSDQHAAKRRWLNAHEGVSQSDGQSPGTDDRHWRRDWYGFVFRRGARLQMAGPALALVYLICGLFSFYSACIG